MAKVFKGNNNIYYSFKDLEISKILQNPSLLANHSMSELDALYKKYYGDYSHAYLSILEAKIKLFDKSESVNSFIFKDGLEWLDKSTRVGLMHLANCSSDNISLVLSNNVVNLSVDKLKNFLAKLEIYASTCFLQTQKHLETIKTLKNSEDIINYDYTTGYPEKIVLQD